MTVKSLYVFAVECKICMYVIEDISTKISEYTCVNHRAWTAIISYAIRNITSDNIRLDSPMVDKNFVSEKQCTSPLASDFYASTRTTAYATMKITLF